MNLGSRFIFPENSIAGSNSCSYSIAKTDIPWDPVGNEETEMFVRVWLQKMEHNNFFS